MHRTCLDNVELDIVWIARCDRPATVPTRLLTLSLSRSLSISLSNYKLSSTAVSKSARFQCFAIALSSHYTASRHISVIIEIITRLSAAVTAVVAVMVAVPPTEAAADAAAAAADVVQWMGNYYPYSMQRTNSLTTDIITHGYRQSPIV